MANEHNEAGTSVHEGEPTAQIIERSPAALDAVKGAIARHVGVTTAVLADVLATTLDGFAEPRTQDPELAMRRLGYLVETLVGAAAGAVIGRVTSATLRSLGSEVAPVLENQLRAALRRIGPGQKTQSAEALTPELPAFVDSSTARPFAEELAVRLHRRLAHASRDHHQVLTRIASAVPAERAATFLATLASLDEDPMLAHLWSEHLLIAWQCYAAAISDAHDAVPAIPPALASSASCETWRAWLRRVRGERVAAEAVASGDSRSSADSDGASSSSSDSATGATPSGGAVSVRTTTPATLRGPNRTTRALTSSRAAR